MSIYYDSSILFICFLMFSINNLTVGQSKSINIIPQPRNIEVDTQTSDIQNLNITLPSTIDAEFVKSLFREKYQVNINGSATANVKFEMDEKLPSEAYLLFIGNEYMAIHAKDNHGWLYGLVTLAQIIRNSEWPLQQMKISDAPKFVYRGMHLDVARHFFSVAEVKRYLDYMAYYKFNHFHWHLTDDQGWRIEIKKYPKLQEVSAFRDETLIGHYNDIPQKFDGSRYGGFYTQDEVRDIVQYARRRGITVIPEIEMPGHAQAALAAYPELGCESKAYKVATNWGVFEDVFCPNEVTFKFLEDVIDEIIPLFPGKYIHIGGDECPKDAWKKSKFCQQLILRDQLHDEHGLQSYFIQRMEKYINSKGKQIIGWDEILEGGLAPNAVVMSWRGIEGGIEAARMHHNVIMTPGSHCYFDYYQSENTDEPLAIGGYIPLEKVYCWNPIPEHLEADKAKYILGGQSNLWTEYITDFNKVTYMAFARGLAMSEALWSDTKDYENFLRRYEVHNDFLTAQGINMANHLYDLKPIINAGDANPISVNFQVPSGVNISYTYDGFHFVWKDNSKSIRIKDAGSYTFQAKSGNHQGRPITLDFDLHKGTKAKFTLETKPSKTYEGQGSGSLVNGVKGSNHKYGGTEWLGFSGTDCIGIFEFKDMTSIRTMDFRFFKAEGQWIYLPRKIDIYTSDDGIQYKKQQTFEDIMTQSKVAEVQLFFEDTVAKYLKFHIHNYGTIPTGSQGAGNGAWLFVDEVVVK